MAYNIIKYDSSNLIILNNIETLNGKFISNKQDVIANLSNYVLITSNTLATHLNDLNSKIFDNSNCSYELIISRLLLLFKNHFNIPVSRSDCDSCSSQANCAAHNHRPNDFGNTHLKFHLGQQLQSHYRARKKTYKSSLPPPFVILLTQHIKGSNQAHLCNHHKEDSSHETTQCDLPRCSLLNERTVAKEGQSRRSPTNYEH